MELILPDIDSVIAAARGSTIVVDTIVLAVTLIKTWETQMNAQKLHMKVPLTTMLIRDGKLRLELLLRHRVNTVRRHYIFYASPSFF